MHVIDSHTGGEPTRLVMSGAPDLGAGSMAERLAIFKAQHDTFRSAVVNEPRGNDAIVGALLCQPVDPTCTAGVIFFNNVGYLGMCGHGTIGLVASLAYLGKIGTGTHRIETPPGVVEAHLAADGKVTIRNVPAYRHAHAVSVNVPGVGVVTGDVAWGGNWFFCVKQTPEQLGQALALSNLDGLTDLAWRIRKALGEANITGANGAEIDHIELYGAPSADSANSKNFVLCPGKAYDRSPCGTGTSAKLACLYADGKLGEGDIWRQESVVGSVFEGSVALVDGQIIPSITGEAFVCAESDLILDPRDPFCNGIRF
ncbi:MAG: proline racemase family protein [Anaerolineae bacterium]|nr:proline racemase family protein [Anaerolineae bacterium]